MQTLGGIAVAHLDQVPVGRQAPVPVIEEALVDGRPRALRRRRFAGQAERAQRAGSFFGVAFDGAREVAFRYWLGGYDQGWVDTGGRREALFGDLPPGGYQLEMLAESRDGLVSPQPARLAIQVAPAW